jgi:hypothetical protein
MSERRCLTGRQLGWRVLAPALGLGILLASQVMSRGFAGLAHAQDYGTPGSPPPVITDLAMKIKEPFTFAGVGDLIIRHPTGQLQDPKFQNLIKPLREADVAFANMEGTLLDLDAFPNPISGGAPIGALADIKAMGIRMVGTANNHSMDGSDAGLFETIKNLNAGGIVYAGTGATLQEARQPRFYNGAKGLVGLVSMNSIDPTTGGGNRMPASYRTGQWGGKPGLNDLGVTPYYIVTAEQLDALRKVRDSVLTRRNEVPQPMPMPRADEPADRLQLFGTWYKVGPKPGSISYTMDERDEKEILRSIRYGKHLSDFMVVTIHCHQNSYAFQQYSFDNDVPDFLVELAHKAIDNGADLFIGHGVHTIRGAEIYKGKPIFYGVSNFVFQLNQHSLAADPVSGGGERGPLTWRGAERSRAAEVLPPGAEIKSDHEERWRPERHQPDNLECLLVTAHFEGGKLVEARLHPVDLGQDYTRPLSRLGIPMTPTPAMAQDILERVQKYSKPFGTVITIENNVGVMRPGPSGTEHTRAGGGAAQ